MSNSNAIIVTGGFLDTEHAKTAHGLIRGTDRFNIVGVIDEVNQGCDAGFIIDGVVRGIPVYNSFQAFESESATRAKYCILGISTHGGSLPPKFHLMLQNAIEQGYGIVSGLHEYVSDNEELATLASKRGVEIIDVRKPKKTADLHGWTGKVMTVDCPKVAVLGTDCNIGKRTTTRMLVKTMLAEGCHAEMIYTGQTGWMQGANYGFIFDSTLNGFVAGELEHAIVQCWKEAKPDIMFIEGQSSLRNPAGPAGSELILSANARSVILQHPPSGGRFNNQHEYQTTIHDLKDEIELIRKYGAETLAISINTRGLKKEDLESLRTEYNKHFSIPIVFPLEEGVGSLVPMLKKIIAGSQRK